MARRGPFKPPPMSVTFSGVDFIPDEATGHSTGEGNARFIIITHHSSLRQQRPGLPQFWEKLFVESELQVRRSCASPSAHSNPNNALHQLNVSQPPTYHEFVKLRQPLADVDPVAR